MAMVARRLCALCTACFLLLVFNLLHLSYIRLPSLHSPPPPPYHHRDRHSLPSSASLKAWPSLPSFLPWLPPHPFLPPFSCEAYFGNGFSHLIHAFPLLELDPHVEIVGRRLLERHPHVEIAGGHLLERHSHVQIAGGRALHDSPSGSLHCFYSETLRTSICEGRKMVMHPEKIHMSTGGEPLESVIGRTDDEELPKFSTGAFEIVVPSTGSSKVTDWSIAGTLLDTLLPAGQIRDHKMRFLFRSIRTTSADQVTCSEEVMAPTLLVTRFEYANLFHTATDWYSAYVASRVVGLEHRPNVLFVDGHCQSPMDDGWDTLFSNVRYAKNFTGAVCFNHVIFTPLGYETALFKGLNSGIPCKGCPSTELDQGKDNTKTARLREFGEMFKAAFGVLNRSTSNDVKILFVRRENYLAHPRHKGKPEARLSNEQELFDSMKAWAQSVSKNYRGRGGQGKNVQVINGMLAHMKMEEQVQAVHDASIIIGVHGAGLTHILFARPGTVILELTSPLFPRPHYSHISHWMGLEYHSISMAHTEANCPQVLEHLGQILASF